MKGSRWWIVAPLYLVFMIERYSLDDIVFQRGGVWRALAAIVWLYQPVVRMYYSHDRPLTIWYH
jgi:hypothetical protein